MLFLSTLLLFLQFVLLPVSAQEPETRTTCLTMSGTSSTSPVPTSSTTAQTTSTVTSIENNGNTTTAARATVDKTSSTVVTVTKRTTVVTATSTVTRFTTTLTRTSFLPPARTTVRSTTTSTLRSTSDSSTFTVPTQAGFLAVQDSLPGASYGFFPTSVSCTVITTFYTTTTVTNGLATVYPTPLTRTVIVRSTRTTTSTIASATAPGTRTIRTATTTTLTRQVTNTFTNLSTSYTMTTVAGPTSTSYAACNPSNIANLVVFPSGEFEIRNAPTRSQIVLREDYSDDGNASPQDCCAFCFSQGLCAAASWVPEFNGGPACVKLMVRDDNGYNCTSPGQYSGGNATSGNFEIQLRDPANTRDFRYQAMNGNCGTFTNSDQPSA